MEPSAEGNLLEIMDLARTLRQEQLFIQQEQAAFAQLSETIADNSTSITKLAYICAQQRHNLNDLIVSRSESGPIVCCRRAHNYDNAKFVDSKKVMDYEHALAYENLFNYLYGAPYLLALSLATGDRLPDVSAQHLNCVINTISMGLYGNAINTKDVEMMLKLLRELIEIQIVGSEQPRRLLRTNSSAFARLYQRLNESMFSAKIFLTAVLYEPLMRVLSDCDVVLDVDPQKVINGLSTKERLRRFGSDTTQEYETNVNKFHEETITKLHNLAKSFIESFVHNWSLFPSTLRWLVQTMCHQLKQAHYADSIINEMIADMVFTHFICPAIISPDIIGIIDAPISEQVRFNLMQIAQIIQVLAVTRHETDVETKYAALHAKFEANMVTNLIDMLLVGQTGEDVVAILSQQSDFERGHLVSTERELKYFAEFFRILSTHDEYDISVEERQKLKKILSHIPAPEEMLKSRECVVDSANAKEQHRSKQSLITLSKVTKSKLAKSMSFNITNGNAEHTTAINHNEMTSTTATSLSAATLSSSSMTTALPNGSAVQINGNHNQTMNQDHQALIPSASNGSISSTSSSPVRSFGRIIPAGSELLGVNEPILIFTIYSVEKNKSQPLTEEEVLKMNSIGQEISNGDTLLVDTAESCNLEHTIDKSSEVNGYDGIDGMSDVLRPLHAKTTRFSLSQDDASIGNSDNLEVVSEAPSNHSVTSSLELEEEQDQNDNLSDMVSANVSGRGTPNISGRDTPSSQVTDGGSVHNALPTPQMQKLLSKARSDIEDKFCKFELKKFEGDENVSIISDTWSTDVLASDSETLEANDRERDRNFSTPLIPSAVVLPGDNNFVDALASAGGAMRVVGSYLDASDQRSESNWSTDVLASDSEKLAEVDTDDNVSITAKSDITDAGARSEAERDMLAAAISARGVRNIRSGTLTSTRNGGDTVGNNDADNNVGNAVVADDTPGSSGDNVSDRSQEDSAFFDAVNLYDESAGAAVGVSRSYQGPSSLARSSVRTTNQYSGENSFQQNYKSGNFEDSGKAAFLATPRMRRQTSAESSISNQSLNLDETNKPPKTHHKSAMKKKKQQQQHVYGNHNAASAIKSAASSDSRDLIDFSDFGGEERPRTSAGAINANIAMTSNSGSQLLERQHLASILCSMEEAAVEHRPNSIEQRNAGDDGRRNGIMALKGGAANVDNGNCRLTPSLRRHQSLNYENHEIMLNVNIPKRVSAMAGIVGVREQQQTIISTTTTATMLTSTPALTTTTSGATITTTAATTTTTILTAQTDDDKQQELLSLCAKANQLQLNESNVPVHEEHFSANISTVHRLASKAAVQQQQQQQQKPTKSTGAIPKSISFDASADKNSSSMRQLNVGQRSNNQRGQQEAGAGTVGGGGGGGVGGQSGIFNKLKQGIFKHRRSNKSQQRHGHNLISTMTDANAVDDFGPSCSNRSVSFNPHSSEVSLEFIAGSSGNRPIGFCDNTEDILAKYRRKVSTSSEATNSDSTGNGIGGLARTTPAAACNNNHGEANLPNVTSLHDKSLAFNAIKKKIRTVLSKTDQHSGDFRQTTYINASPLQTYLQIQLAQAINLQNFQQISYVSEAIRCIATLEPKQHAQLLEELQNDIQKRQNYLQYLMRYRQNMLLIMENLEQFEARLRSESTSCNRYLMHVCIRFYLESCQTKIDAFQEEFTHLTTSDDKIELIEEFIERLMQELQSNGGILHNMPEWQAIEARSSIERILLQRIYQQVMFPNDDADLSRDTVLSEHISKLQRIICPSHPALCIPQEYLAEAPWTFAQQQLSYISAYKTPREKLECVIRCISSIMSLLHMSSGRTPASDDVLPVLIYVVIMANPPYLLSTVEYISCFIGDKLEGEAQYYWTLFGSVVKFIKTMDYFD